MDHEKFKDIVMAYHDGELSQAEANQAVSHLSMCSECRQNMEEWESIRSGLFKKIKIPPTPDMTQPVMNRINIQIESLSSARPSLPWWVPAVGFGFASLLLVMTYVPQSESVTVEDILTVNGGSAAIDQVLDYSTGDEL